MRTWKALLAAFALAGLVTPAGAVPLDGRYDAFVEAAAACVRATGPKGVDRAVIASAGWPAASSAETDHTLLSWAHSPRNPFVIRMNSHDMLEPEHCWFVAEFERQRDYDEVRRRLERLIGRAPDAVDADDMRGTRWTNAENELELWMMPASKLCSECPEMFFTVKPRGAE
jgi:hypothetical protein